MGSDAPSSGSATLGQRPVERFSMRWQRRAPERSLGWFGECHRKQRVSSLARTSHRSRRRRRRMTGDASHQRHARAFGCRGARSSPIRWRRRCKEVRQARRRPTAVGGAAEAERLFVEKPRLERRSERRELAFEHARQTQRPRAERDGGRQRSVAKGGRGRRGCGCHWRDLADGAASRTGRRRLSKEVYDVGAAELVARVAAVEVCQ